MFAVLACAVAVGCTEPSEVVRLVRPELTVTRAGHYCRVVRFTITSDTTVTPDYPDNSCAGTSPGLLARQLVGQQMTWSAANGRTLTIPVRIENRTTGPLQLPIRVELQTSGKKVLIPLEASNTKLVPTNPDSTLANGVVLWLVGGTGTLAGGDTSAVRNLVFTVDTPVVKGELQFLLKSEETLAGFPPTAPDTFAAYIKHDSSYAADLGYLKRTVGVRFNASATVAARAAAIDGVGGAVVGGVPFDDSEGFYYIAIGTDTSLAAIGAAIEVLSRQAAVAAAIVVQRLVPMARRPDDGPGFEAADWALSPDSAAGGLGPRSRRVGERQNREVHGPLRGDRATARRGPGPGLPAGVRAELLCKYTQVPAGRGQANPRSQWRLRVLHLESSSDTRLGCQQGET